MTITRNKFFCLIFLFFLLTCKISALSINFENSSKSLTSKKSEKSTNGEKSENFFLKNLNLNFEPYVTARLGVQDEFVYTENSLGETKILSELNWEQKPIFFGGIKTQIGFCGFNLAFKYQEALPLKCGTVFDSDWVNVITDGAQFLVAEKWTLDSTVSSYKTNYSESECKLERYYNWILELNYTKEFQNQIGIKLFAQFDYSYSSFWANGGTYWYGAYNSSENYYEDYTTVENASYFSGKVLALERINYITWAGFSLSARFSHFSFCTDFAVCPFIHTDSLDSHFLRSSTGTYFLDEMNSFFSGVKFGFLGKFYFNLQNFISLELENTFINSLYGTTYSAQSRSDKFTLISGNSGASFKFVDFTFSFCHLF